MKPIDIPHMIDIAESAINKKLKVLNIKSGRID